ncbi:hypothetical protein [Algicola sagamiensis]|uniref:hypothetical protein n=1 Tax=Algicola sagamiensis TaxID=163869 RepID=UPI0003A9FE53|nr:hypothetical protein [Algicola sagamiensis]
MKYLPRIIITLLSFGLYGLCHYKVLQPILLTPESPRYELYSETMTTLSFLLALGCLLMLMILHLQSIIEEKYPKEDQNSNTIEKTDHTDFSKALSFEVIKDYMRANNSKWIQVYTIYTILSWLAMVKVFPTIWLDHWALMVNGFVLIFLVYIFSCITSAYVDRKFASKVFAFNVFFTNFFIWEYKTNFDLINGLETTPLHIFQQPISVWFAPSLYTLLFVFSILAIRLIYRDPNFSKITWE